MAKHFLTLITRCRDEPFLLEFVNHYFHEGVDFIYILDDNLNMEMPDEVLKDRRIEVVKSQKWTEKDNRQLLDLNILFDKIRRDSEWIISVDCDEFLTTKKRSDSTIRDELRTTFKDADCVLVPWAMMSSGNRKEDPISLLEEVTDRWDHDKRHLMKNGWQKGRCRYERIEVKSIFRGNKVRSLDVHHPEPLDLKSFLVLDGVGAIERDLTPFYDNLRNHHIESAILICYHYRIISESSALRKMMTSQKLKGGGGYKNVSLETIMASDYPELTDLTLMLKSQKRRAQKKKSNFGWFVRLYQWVKR